MELLTIKHQDFEMIVECAKFDDIWYKAKSNIGEECLHSTYSWSEGVSSVILSNYIGEEITAQLQISVAYFCSIGLYFHV